MFKRTKVSAGVFLALGGSLLCGALPAGAQERVEVTGTRIRTIGAVSASPVTSVTAEEVNSSQPVAVEEVIRSLPATIPAIGPGTNNGSGGGATIDLRGLGPNRTLVLINGRRVVPFDLFGRVDTNTIPIALIDRIDLVTGGASAVYGADAVSGVVNFVLKRNFNGIEATTKYEESEKGDARRYRSDFTLGTNIADGRGNAVLSVGTTRTEPLTQGERDFGFYQLSSTDGSRGGSQTAVPAVLAGMPAPLTGLRGIDLTTGTLRPYVATRDDYNFNPPNYYVTPLDRTQVTALGRFTINDYAEAYAELFHTKSKVTLNLASTGSFTSTYSLPIGNPFIPAAMRQQLCQAYAISAANCVEGNATEIRLRIQRRITELGPRINDFDNNMNQWTVGLRGALPGLSSWNYDAYLQRGTFDFLSARVNWGSFSKVQQALRAVNRTTCTVNTNGCVPLNLFGPEGSITQAMMNFINLTAVQTAAIEQRVANATVSGDVGKLPWAKESISLAFGLEKRDQKAGNRSDGPSQIQGEVLGTGAPLPDRQGTIKLDEAYAETIVPIAGGLPGVFALNFEGGYRQTEFKTEVSGKNYGSWKYGVNYAPFRGLKFRAMQQRATRAPNINELYAPVVTGLSNLAIDPCQGDRINTGQANTAGTLSNLCRATGVPMNQIGFVPAPSAGQINNTGGGNPNLGPEEADTTTIGLVFEPEFAPGLSVTLDWFNIEIDKAVSNATTSQVLNGCYTAALNPGFDPNNVFCQAIQRDPAGTLNGGLGVVTQLSNLGKYKVSGVDLGIKYRLRLGGMGRVDLSLDLSHLDNWDFKSLPTVDTLNCLGVYGVNCGGPTSKQKFSQRATWYYGPLIVGYNWRFIGGTKVEPGTGTWLPEYSSIKDFHYVDLAASYDVTKWFRVSLAVNNAFDKKPPIVGNTIATTSTNSGNTFPQWYDVVGRAWSLTARIKF